MEKQPISIQDVIQELRDLFRVTNRGFFKRDRRDILY